MKRLIFLLLTVCSLPLGAQWLWDYGVAVGASNYLGDIGGSEQARRDFIADMKLAKTRWNVGGFVRYKWRPKVSLKLALDYLRVEGDDKLSMNPARVFRNFNFRNDIYDLGATAEYFFYENNDLGGTYRYRNNFKIYGFIGIGAFYHNPKTLYKDEWVSLAPLATEGTYYRQIVMNIPMGVGFYFTFNKAHRFGFEMNYRKTFTDYIDDISGNYPEDPGDAYMRGLILRSTELDPQLQADNPGVFDSHTWGAKRGDNTNLDAYITVSLSYSHVIRGKSSFYRTRNNGFFSKKFRRGRRIRAKF